MVSLLGLFLVNFITINQKATNNYEFNLVPNQSSSEGEKIREEKAEP